MSYASLMVYVEDVARADARIHLACDLAEQFGARLIGVCGGIPDMPAVDPYTGGAALGDALAMERDIAESDIKRAEARFRDVAGALIQRIEWRGALDYPVELVAREARAADLIILGRESLRPTSRHAADPGDVMMSAGRPVLVVPPDFMAGPITQRIVVAWKEGREARRALADALPLLRKAAQTTVVCVSEEDELQPARQAGEDVASFLLLHEVNAKCVALPAGEEPPADRLIDYAEKDGARLIVLGGYGHTRAREWAFGGVTRSMLKSSPICCLFSH